MDDNPDILEVASDILRNLEYQFDLARNGEEAIALYQRQIRHGEPYDAVILDLTIANGMGGEEAFLKIKDMDPGVRAIVSSGYNSEETTDYFLAKGFKGILAKPYRSGEMKEVLRQVLDRARP